MEAGVLQRAPAEISKAMELKAFCGSPSAARLKKVAFSRQSCLFLPNEIDSKNFCFKHPALVSGLLAGWLRCVGGLGLGWVGARLGWAWAARGSAGLGVGVG